METKDLVNQNHAVLNLVYQNQKVLNAMQNLVLQSKSHIEFLAAAYPEIRTNLQTIAESLQVVHHSLGTVCELSETQEKVHKQTVSKFELEKACKNQAYDFILTERLLNRFKLFCSCYPVSTYDKKTGCDIISK